MAQPYATCSAAQLAERAAPLAWLAEGLFLQGGAGILGGAPKSLKSYFALDLCVAVATASPCAGRFCVPSAGPVLVLNAEDPDAVVVERLTALGRARGRSLAQLCIDLIVEPGVRLPEGLDRLIATVTAVRPKLLVLDPLIRLHRADENSSTEMSVILDGLRSLARDTGTSLLLVHHARKAPAGSAGAALRGSSDLWAFGDTNLYLRKVVQPDILELRIEQRACVNPPPLRLALSATDATACFQILPDEVTDPNLANDVLQALTGAHAPVAAARLRQQLGVRNQSLADALRRLAEQGRIRRDGRSGWSLAEPAT